MLKLSKKVEYGLMALKYIQEAKEGQLVSAREICDHFSIPFDTLAKVLQGLTTAKILCSGQGTKGGYILIRPLTEVSMMNFIEIMEGRSFNLNCMRPNKSCELIENCNIIAPLERLNLRLNHYLDSLTLHELLYGEEVFFKNQFEQNQSLQMDGSSGL